MAEQLGTGGSDGNTIPGDLKVGGKVGFYGAAAATTKPVVTLCDTSSLTEVTATVNATLLALKQLGIITSNASA